MNLSGCEITKGVLDATAHALAAAEAVKEEAEDEADAETETETETDADADAAPGEPEEGLFSRAFHEAERIREWNL